jgi:uncharacterized phage protein gp47/JayE
MPWVTPSLKQVRELTRDGITTSLYGAVFIGNNVLRVMADAMAGLAHHVLRYIDWLADQLLPDTAETEWLDRHGQIWLTNSDGTIGRKLATLAAGSVNATGTAGVVVPQGSILLAVQQISYETLDQITLGAGPTPINIRALDPGILGNMDPAQTISFAPTLPGIDSVATVIQLAGGTDTESDDDLRVRVLERIQNPPMGGDQEDYVHWALQVPGVTRAWCFPNEMGIGTVSIRFMMDDLFSAVGGIPSQEWVTTVAAHIDTVRPVAIKDCFVLAPIPYPLTFYVTQLNVDNPDVRASIEANIKDAFLTRAIPGQPWYRSWTDEAIANAVGENHHELIFNTTPMPSNGHIATLGSIVYQ